mgnify:CR=1 FL=1
MKIGIVLANTPSYSETFFNSKIKKLKETEHEVILFSPNRNQYKKTKVVAPLKISVLGFLKFFVYTIIYWERFNKFYKAEVLERKSKKRALKNLFLNTHILTQKLDWLHFGYATMVIQRELVAETIGAKMAVSFRGYDIGIFPLKHKDCYNLLWKKIDKIHTISDDLLKKAYKLGLNINTPFEKITPAIDINLFKNSNDINFEKLNFITVARLHWKKGLDLTLFALKKIKEEGVDFTYKIIGVGDELEKITYLISELNLEDNVFLLGKLSPENVIKELSKSNVFLQYSLQEGFCNAVLEAQAMGLFSIVSDAEGLSENIINNKTGFVVEKYNVEKLYNAILKFIDKKALDKKEYSLSAISNVRENYNLEKQQKEFLNFYNIIDKV